MMAGVRKETDSLGEVDVPADKLWGAQTQRALEYAYRLYTGPDGNSHVVRGSIGENNLVEAQSILFKESPPHSSSDWHNDPIPQNVLTLAGVLEFTMLGGETFTIYPGDVLLLGA